MPFHCGCDPEWIFANLCALPAEMLPRIVITQSLPLLCAIYCN